MYGSETRGNNVIVQNSGPATDPVNTNGIALVKESDCAKVIEKIYGNPDTTKHGVYPPSVAGPPQEWEWYWAVHW